MHINELKNLLYKSSAANNQMSAGNQAMALAAQMATPAGAPPLPKAVQPPVPEQVPQEQPSMESELQSKLDEKDKVISELRQEVEKSKIEAEREKSNIALLKQQQEVSNNIQKQYAELDKRKNEIATAEKMHKMQLAVDTANQKTIDAANKAKTDVAMANSIADAKSKLSADAAKEYVNTTNSIRRATEEKAKANSYIPVSLTNQINDASSAAKNALSLTQKWINKNASLGNYNQSAINSPGINNKGKVTGANTVQNRPSNTVGLANTQKPTPTTNSNYGAHTPTSKAPVNPDYLIAQRRKNRNRDLTNLHIAQSMNPIGDSALDMYKSKTRADVMQSQYDAGTTNYNRWENAKNISSLFLNKKKTELEKLKSEGNANASEELAKIKDFQQKQNRSGTIEVLDLLARYGTLPAATATMLMKGIGVDTNKYSLANAFGAYKSDEDLFREAIAKGKNPETFTYADSDKGWFNPVYNIITSNKSPIGWISNYIVDPITSGVGNAVLENERSSMMANNRGVSRNWWSDDYDTEAGKLYYDAAKQRGIKHSILGNYGSITGNAALSASYFIPTVGLGTGAARLALSAGGRQLGNAGKALLARNVANASGSAMRRAGVNMRLMGRNIKNFNKNVIGGYNKSAIGRAGNYLSYGALGGSLLGLAGNNVNSLAPLQYLDPYRYLGSNNYGQDIGFYGTLNNGQIMDQNGSIYNVPNTEMTKYSSLNNSLSKIASKLTVGAYAWNDPVLRSFNRSNLFNSTRLGKTLKFIDPLISNATGGLLKIKPSVELKGGVPYKTNAESITEALSNIVQNNHKLKGRTPLFNSIVNRNQEIINGLI